MIYDTYTQSGSCRSSPSKREAASEREASLSPSQRESSLLSPPESFRDCFQSRGNDFRYSNYMLYWYKRKYKY
jgi:hypothetical protein